MANSGYIVNDSIKSQRLILCKSQYVRARIVAHDLPIRLMFVIGSPNTSPILELMVKPLITVIFGRCPFYDRLQDQTDLEVHKVGSLQYGEN